MSNKSLPRKYRPQNLSEVCGQEHVTTSLINCFKRKNIPNVFLFSGQFGAGKTTTARIVSSMLNCENGPTISPCGKCLNCKKIYEGTSIDIQEIDSATNRGIDKIRSLKEFAKYAPVEMRNKIIILDECHQLTSEANDSLLKLLEEPPSNLYIFLCTTEPREMISTIHSRCQRYDFRKIDPMQIYEYIVGICKKEEIKYEEEALKVIAKISDGSMRDALKNIESLRNYCEDTLLEEKCYKLFGIPDLAFSFKFVNKVMSRKFTEGIILIDEFCSKGVDPAIMIKEVSSYLRDLMVLKVSQDQSLVTYSGPVLEKIKDQANRVNVIALLKMMKLFEKAMSATVYNLQPKHIFEKVFVESAILYYNEEKKTEKGP